MLGPRATSRAALGGARRAGAESLKRAIRVVRPMSDPPAQALDRAHDQKVRVLLKDGRVLNGRLLGCDEHLNLVLDEAEETNPELARRLGRVVVRGSNIVTVNVPGGAPGRAA